MEKITQEKGQIVEPMDEDSNITKRDFDKTFISTVDGHLISLDRNNIMIVGQSMAGKTLLLNNMLKKWFLHKIKSQNIHIFSPTASFDLNYRPAFQYIIDQLQDDPEGKLNLYEDVEMDRVKEIVNKQKKIQKRNMASTKKNRETVDQVLFIFDDILGSAQMKSHQSDLSNFTTVSRHSKITNIFMTQSYASIPNKIRQQTPLVFLMNCDNYSDLMAVENSLKGQHQLFMRLYQMEIILKKDYSFLIVDKSAKIDRRFFICEQGKRCYSIDILGNKLYDEQGHKIKPIKTIKETDEVVYEETKASDDESQ